MSNPGSARVAVEPHASTLAIRASRLVEQILIELGTDAARSAGAAIVTREHVESCIDVALLDELRARLVARSQDVEPNERRKFA